MSVSLILNLLWTNKKLIGEVIGLILLLVLCWWFFWHNPKVIEGLQKDKQELSRQIESWKEVQAFQEKVLKENKRIDHETFKNISTIKASTVPRRTIIITGGVPLPPMR